MTIPHDIEQLVRESTQITDFQRRVYLELLKTKIGDTLSYSELATRLGYKRSSAICRAIGQALKRNPWSYGWQQNHTPSSVDLSLLQQCVPCHRVIRSDGSIGGYLGETQGEKISLKQALLALERSQINHSSSNLINFATCTK